MDFYLDHDFIGMDASAFFCEFRRRVAALSLEFVCCDGEGSPKSPSVQNGWVCDCYGRDYITAFLNNRDIDFSFYKNGESKWSIFLNDNTFHLFIADDDLHFSPTRRWSFFEEHYLKNRDISIGNTIARTLNEIRRFILPVFHCTKMIAIGDQGYYEEFIGSEMDAGKTMEEALCNPELEKVALVTIYRHGDSKVYTGENWRELPVWMCEF